MSQAEVLIISGEAKSYASLLTDLDCRCAQTPQAAVEQYQGEGIVLGEPDIIALALPDLPAVRWVQSTWAGLVPLLGAAADGIQVTGVKGVFGPQMAEYSLGYMLANELGILTRRERQARREWYNADTGNLRGKTLGVMGTGSIGQEIALRAQVMGMTVVGFSRSGSAIEPFSEVYGLPGKNTFLAGLDYLVSVLPDTPGTTGLLDAGAFATLPAHAVLINVGRGNVIDDEALVGALDSGELAGAVLDVFNEEPLPADHRFWDTPGLLMTGHVAARSYPADIVKIFRDNLEKYLQGLPLNYLLDPARGY